MSKPETLSEARAWDARKEAYSTAGYPDAEAARRAWDVAEEPDPNEPAALLRMLAKDGDAKIAKDLDCYPCGACRRVECVVCEYAKARKKARGFIAKNYLANNHRQISEHTMLRLRKMAEPKTKTKSVRCQNCRKPFNAQRVSAKWCSPTCRKSGSRAA